MFWRSYTIIEFMRSVIYAVMQKNMFNLHIVSFIGTQPGRQWDKLSQEKYHLNSITNFKKLKLDSKQPRRVRTQVILHRFHHFHGLHVYILRLQSNVTNKNRRCSVARKILSVSGEFGVWIIKKKEFNFFLSCSPSRFVRTRLETKSYLKIRHACNHRTFTLTIGYVQLYTLSC